MKTVLITGCSEGGIGSSLVLAFQRHGLHVFATSRNVSKMSHLKDLPNVTLPPLEVTDSSQITAAVEAVKGHTGGTLDCFVNNAGRSYFMPTLDIDIGEAKGIFESNFWGALSLIQAFAPLIIAAKGTIVNNCSVSGHVNVPWLGLYAASKRSLELVSEALRLEMVPLGVKVVTLVTGAVKSQGQTHFGDFKLPPTSKYLAIEDAIANRARGGDGFARMDTERYAEHVVKDVLRGATGRLWVGNTATVTKWTSALLPDSLIDKGVVKGTGLDVMPKE